MNSYIADAWAITNEISILHNADYVSYCPIYDYRGYIPWRLSIRDDQYILMMVPRGIVAPYSTKFSGLRIWFSCDPKISLSSPFELILRPEAEIDYLNETPPFCNFCIRI